MSESLPNEVPSAPDGQPGVQPVRDRDTSIEPDPTRDPAQVEWDRTTAADAGIDPDQPATATGDDPAQIPADDDDIPPSDLVSETQQPETQGQSPEAAELGDEGQGDLAPEDL